MIRHVWRALAYWPHRAWRCLVEDGWKAAVCRVLGIATAFAIGGVLFIALGLPSIAANTGHWPLTRQFLGIVMQHTVRMRTLGKDAPPLDDPALVLKGAGHYATGCAPCHGAPGRAPSLITRQMLPEPPDLAEGGRDHSPAALFWIIKHGLKYTAMPAWPTQQRDDEVWAMVAFVRRLPQLDPDGYRALAYGDVAMPTTDGVFLDTLGDPPQSTLDNCARCHGRHGDGRGHGAFPRLAGQREAYLLASLRAYARGERHSGIMQPIAAGLSDAQMRALARHYASLGPFAGAAQVGGHRGESRHGHAETDAATAAKGAELATHGLGERRIPACRHCHGPGARERNPLYPDLAGQYADYLELQLQLFRHGRRGGTPYARIMHTAASALTPEDIRALAAYYASAPADADAGATAAPATVPRR